LGLDGVKDIRMLLDRDEFEITYDPSKTTLAQLIEAAKKTGYTSRVTETAKDIQSDTKGASVPKGIAFLDQAMDRARLEHLPVVLVFSAEWCVPCKKFARDALSNARVKDLLDRCVFLVVDADKEPELSQRMGVEGLPDIRFLNPDGSPVKRFTERPDPEFFADELEALLKAFPPGK
jgi:thiol:disulfide interchange protein